MKALSFCGLSLCALVLATLLGGCLGLGPARVPAATDPRDPAFLPLGVYWAGEYTFREEKDDAVRWAKIDAALDGLAARHANAVWLTHCSAAETAEFARRGAKRGIGVVASIAELAGEVEHIRKGDHAALIARTLAAWGPAPKPIAWGLGDEPRAGYMAEMKGYADAWHTRAPGEPVATVVMWSDTDAAATAGFDALAADVYPFFSPGNPNGYGMPDWAAWTTHTRNLVARTPRPWMMGQAYQEPWGPFELDPHGNIVYLRGGGPHWVMPTPDQIRWQALSAVALGAKGMFYFHFRAVIAPNPKGAAVTNLPAAAKRRTSSGAPGTLVYADGRPTPQYEAMGEAFAWLQQHAGRLARLKLSPVPEAWETQPAAVGGNVVRVLLDGGSPQPALPASATKDRAAGANAASGKRFLMVVSSYAARPGQPVRVTLGPHITGLRSLTTGKRVRLTLAAPLRQAEVVLPPATAELFECTVDPDNLPTAYTDDFSTEKFKTDAVTVQNVIRHGSGSVMLSAAHGGFDRNSAFVVYDVDKLLPPLSPGGVRILTYEGGANPPEWRGAFWSASADGKTFTPLSQNEFGKQLFFSQRYLKVGFSWRQAGSAHYGCLTGFSVAQWPRPAR